MDHGLIDKTQPSHLLALRLCAFAGNAALKSFLQRRKDGENLEDKL